MTGDDPAAERGSLSTDNLGLSLKTQTIFTFTALLYGSAADICEAEGKNISLDDFPSAKSAFQCQRGSEAAQNEGHLKIGLFMQRFHDVL